MSRRFSRCSYTTVEVIFVVVIVAILSGVALFRANPTSLLRAGLTSDAQRLAGDLRLTRSLAITHAEQYRLNLDQTNKEYSIFDSSLAQVGETRTLNPDITVSADASFIFEALGNTNPASDLTVTLTAGGDQYDIVITPATGVVTLTKS